MPERKKNKEYAEKQLSIAMACFASSGTGNLQHAEDQMDLLEVSGNPRDKNIKMSACKPLDLPKVHLKFHQSLVAEVILEDSRMAITGS